MVKFNLIDRNGKDLGYIVLKETSLMKAVYRIDAIINKDEVVAPIDLEHYEENNKDNYVKNDREF